MNDVFWREIRECFDALRDDTKCRAIVLSGAGPLFTIGIDASEAKRLVEISQSTADVARKSRTIYNVLLKYQDSFTALEKCGKPVIACIHGACFGGGLHMICATDIRYCTSDASFRLRAAEMGLVADVGALQRLPKLIGNDGLVRELAYTGAALTADEAEKCGLVRRVFSDKASMLASAFELAESIAATSPIAVQGTKHQLNYARDHSVEQSLEYQASWSMMTLQSEDLVKAATALMGKTKANFSDY